MSHAERRSRPRVNWPAAIRQHGFTLIELLVAFGIVSMLALLATTIWQAQTVHRHVESGLANTEPVLEAVAEAFDRLGEPPADRIDAGLPADPAVSGSRYVGGVDVVDGRVDIRFGHRAHADIAGRVLRLTPYVDADGGLVWRCDPPPAAEGLRPLANGRPESPLRQPASPLLRRHYPDICHQRA